MRGCLESLSPRLLGEDELARFGDPRRICLSVNDADDLRRAERLLAGGSARRDAGYPVETSESS